MTKVTIPDANMMDSTTIDSTSRLRVLVSFRRPRPTTNPYIVQVANAVAAQPGTEVLNFGWRVALTGSYDVFHAHWPDILIGGPPGPKQWARKLLFALLMVRFGLQRIPVVRTVHNLAPHERGTVVERALLRWFDRLTTRRILLNDAAGGGPAGTVLLHGHYIDWFADHRTADRQRNTVLFAGLIRGYKNIPGLIAAFRDTSDPELRLRLTGQAADPALLADLAAAAAADGRISTRFEYLADADLVHEVTGAELVVLPYRELYNSGAALMALSLNRPVLVPAGPTTDALAAEVGVEWVQRYHGELTATALITALDQVRQIPPGSAPDLSARTWTQAGVDHLVVYRAAIADRRSTAGVSVRGARPGDGLRIVFDAYWWVDGPPSLRHVLRETVLGWHERNPQDELTVVVRRRSGATARATLPAGVNVATTRLYPQAFSAVWSCRRAARRISADVVYTQNYTTHLRHTVSAVFLHDVLFRTNPEWFTRAERLYFAPMVPLAGLADVVLTSSHTEADRIRRHSRARYVEPVGIGVSEELIAAPSTPTDGLVSGSFLLTVGRLNVRKNLGNTIEGAIRSGVISVERPLVVVGGADGKDADLPQTVRDAVSAGSVRFTGFIDDGRLRWLYENTGLFLFLTLGEGFGMPVAEARHFGAPMVISDIEVFTEVAPADVRRVEAGDVDAIAGAIRETVSHGPRLAYHCPDDVHHAHSWERTLIAMRAAVTERVAARPVRG